MGGVNDDGVVIRLGGLPRKKKLDLPDFVDTNTGFGSDMKGVKPNGWLRVNSC